MSADPDRDAIDRFHQAYYDSRAWHRNTFLGYRIQQCPFDLQIYQELIHRLRPGFILQTGVAGGGSVRYFAALLDLIGADPSAVVVGVDLRLSAAARTLEHPRVRLVEGSSTDPATVAKVEALLPAGGGMVSLDANHTRPHVERELAIYPAYVAVGSYLVVEDTNVNGRPVLPGYGPGPFEAVEAFLGRDDRFERDDALGRAQLFSFHQHGWLRRVR